jgi:trans-aconitate methyltransferase
MRSTDPRIVSLNDIDNAAGDDHDYYRSLANRPGVHRVIDLGCGTGLLTITLPNSDRTVTGIDPDPGMLNYAKQRPGAERVRWILGDSSSIEEPADLVVMTGNVAQHIVGDAWDQTLGHITAALRPGGQLAFESRHPAAKEWRNWDRDHTYGTRQTAHGPLTEWLEITSIDDAGTVTFDA